MEMFLVALLVTTGICHVMTAPSPQVQLEDFLYRYGYLPATDRENGVKRSETDLEQATMRLQKFAGLKITGKLNEQTLKLIGTPRCGMPDMVVKNDDILGVVQVNDGPSNYTLLGTVWESFPVTYGFINFTPDLAQNIVERVIDESIKLWTDVSGLTCSKISDGNSADMKILFGAGQHDSCGGDFDGPSGVLAHAYQPGAGILGDTHFDEDEDWTDGSYSGINLKWVAIHEFGHAIGIGHSDVLDAIMYPYYTGYTPNPQLKSDDINAAQAMYGDYVGVCGTSLGFEPRARTYVDSAQVQTMVLKESFSSGGVVKTIKVYSSYASRRLRVGIYRPSGSAGSFTLVDQAEFATVPVGNNELSTSLQVQAGDSFGITWLDYGVVEWDYASAYNYYDSWYSYSVGDQATLSGSQYGNREYSIQACQEASPCVEQGLGFPTTSRTYVDTAWVQTFVLKETFTSDGEINTVIVYSRNAGRRFRVGIYRPTGSANQFTVVQQKEWSSIAVGNTELTLSGSDVFQVQAGDSFGFTWLDYGVVEWNYASDYNYYDSWASYSVGDQATLSPSQHGNREYSVRLENTC